MNDTALRTLARTYGTPLYAFDAAELARRSALLRSSLPAGTGLCYAVKANTFILPELAPAVDRFEVCSPGELRIYRALSLPSEKLVVSGVHKDRATVKDALRADAPPAALTVESAAHMELIGRVAAEKGVRAPVLLRLTSGNQFGLDRAALKELVRAHADDPRFELRGVQYFSGTQKTSLKRLEREADKLARLAEELERECAWHPAEIEWGPGLPVSYYDADGFDEAAFLAALGDMVRGLSGIGHVTLEVGRSLAASCGTYLTRVVDVKRNAGQAYAIVDGGMHHLVYYGGSMALRQPPVRVLGDGDAAFRPAGEKDAPPASPGDGPWNICGSLCTVNDILVKQLDAPGLAVGSVLAFGRAGAYCPTEGMNLFLSRDLPRIAVVSADGNPRLVRSDLPTHPLNTPAGAR